jgi:hypothetical protein
MSIIDPINSITKYKSNLLTNYKQLISIIDLYYNPINLIINDYPLISIKELFYYTCFISLTFKTLFVVGNHGALFFSLILTLPPSILSFLTQYLDAWL